MLLFYDKEEKNIGVLRKKKGSCILEVSLVADLGILVFRVQGV